MAEAAQRSVFAALGWMPPRFHYVPLLCDDRGEKLSKREAGWGLLPLQQTGLGQLPLWASWRPDWAGAPGQPPLCAGTAGGLDAPEHLHRFLKEGFGIQIGKTVTLRFHPHDHLHRLRWQRDQRVSSQRFRTCLACLGTGLISLPSRLLSISWTQPLLLLIALVVCRSRGAD